MILNDIFYFEDELRSMRDSFEELDPLVQEVLEGVPDAIRNIRDQEFNDAMRQLESGLNRLCLAWTGLKNDICGMHLVLVEEEQKINETGY